MRTTFAVLALVMLAGCTQTATPPPATDQAKGGPGRHDGDDDQPILIAANYPNPFERTDKAGMSYVYGKNRDPNDNTKRKPKLSKDNPKQDTKGTFKKDYANWLEDHKGNRIFLGTNWKLQINSKHAGKYIVITEENKGIHVDMTNADSSTIDEDHYILTDEIDNVVSDSVTAKFELPLCLYYWNGSGRPPDNPCDP